jgi:cytochrome c oxidase subunit 3
MSDHPLTPSEKKDVALLGMWVFLGSETLFFGALFLSLAVYRHLFPEALAEGTKHLRFALGTMNTAVLLTSSLTMALAGQKNSKHARAFLHATAFLGIVFLVIKAIEYAGEWKEGLVPGLHLAPGTPPHLALFFCFYFFLTAIHGLHLTIGIGLTEWLAFTLPTDENARERRTEVAGLYWHFVDLVWVFLYPALYLWGRA